MDFFQKTNLLALALCVLAGLANIAIGFAVGNPFNIAVGMICFISAIINVLVVYS